MFGEAEEEGDAEEDGKSVEETEKSDVSGIHVSMVRTKTAKIRNERQNREERNIDFRRCAIFLPQPQKSYQKSTISHPSHDSCCRCADQEINVRIQCAFDEASRDSDAKDSLREFLGLKETVNQPKPHGDHKPRDNTGHTVIILKRMCRQAPIENADKRKENQTADKKT